MAKIDKEISEEFQQIKLNLDEHLSAINENTTEIQSLFEYLQCIENKVDKLSQRLDSLQINANNNNNNFSLGENRHERPTIIPLNHTEKKVFLTLYTEELPLSCSEISTRARLLNSIVQESLINLNKKGIPLLRTLINNQIFVRISPTFKEMQAKENLINLSLESFM